MSDTEIRRSTPATPMPPPRTALAALTTSPGGELSRPADLYIADGQRERIEQLLDDRQRNQCQSGLPTR